MTVAQEQDSLIGIDIIASEAAGALLGNLPPPSLMVAKPVSIRINGRYRTQNGCVMTCFEKDGNLYRVRGPKGEIHEYYEDGICFTAENALMDLVEELPEAASSTKIQEHRESA